MIQRIQSIYLFLAGILALTSCWFLDLWKQANEWLQAEDYLVLMVPMVALSLISIANIFMFRNRKTQILLNRLNIVLSVFVFCLMAYKLYNLPGEFGSEKGIGLITPFVLILLLFLANREIMKDEKLIKSVDRIR